MSGNSAPSKTSTASSLADENEEVETRWTDDRIRWDDVEKVDEKDEEEATAMMDPFKADPHDTFSFRFELNYDENPIDISLRGYKAESDQVWQSTGLTLWRASEFLCHYLVKHPELVQEKRVLELGAGLGLVGILAHLMGSATVCVTDGDTDALVELRANVKRNARNDTISSHQLLWGCKTSATFLERHGLFDIVLASDIIYAKCIVEPLWETLQMLLKPSGVFVLAFARRKVPISIDFVMQSAQEAGFVYECTEEDTKEGIFVHILRRKKEND